MTKNDFIIECTLRILQGFAMVGDNYSTLHYSPENAAHTARCVAEVAAHELELEMKVFDK